jgi:peptidyl-prolyl cis-trans isomerase B (cyclophilin B)
MMTMMTAAAVLATGWMAAATAHKGSKKMAKLDPAHTQATLVTDFGDITIRFYFDKAPHHVENFIELSEKHVYDGVLFHRVIPSFMIQTASPDLESEDAPGIDGHRRTP